MSPSPVKESSPTSEVGNKTPNFLGETLKCQ